MAKVEIKQPIVDEIKGYAADAKAAVLVDYRGLTVEQDTKLRKALREAGVGHPGAVLRRGKPFVRHHYRGHWLALLIFRARRGIRMPGAACHRLRYPLSP